MHKGVNGYSSFFIINFEHAAVCWVIMPGWGWGAISVPDFEKTGSEKNECLEGKKEPLPQFFAFRGLICFLSKNTS